MSEFVYILGILLQAAAGVMALLQVRKAPHRLPWLLIAISALLIVFRRSATLGEFMRHERELASAEVITLIVSLLFFFGVLLMTRMFRDVAKAHEAMKESSEHFRLLADNAPEAIFIQTDFRFAYLNKACLRHFGAESLGDLLGKPVIDRFHPSIHPLIRERIRLLNEERTTVELVEQKHVRLDGEIISAEVSAVPFRFKGKNGALVFVRNITERKRLEQALQESEEKYRTIADFTADWEYWQASDGGFVYVSPSCEKVTGYSADEFMQDPGLMLRIIHPEDRESLICFNFDQHMLIEGEHVGADLRIITNTREIRWIGHRCQAVYSKEGRFLGRRGSNRDVTARKLAEQEVIFKNDQLQKALAEKEAFFSIIAHDLRSPLSGLIGMTGLLIEDLDGLSREELQRLAKEMGQSVQNLFNLLENLLEWSQMQRGLTAFEPSACALDELVRRNIELLQAVAEQKKIALQNAVAADTVILADQSMLNTVLRNLISNAIKFVESGGSVDVSARKDGAMITVAVQDNGIGMDQKTLAGLFALDKKRTRRGTAGERGTGLGLVLCKQFIEQHGGSIWVESEPGKGTTVFFTLPVSD